MLLRNLLLLSPVVLSSVRAQYNLVKEYAGQNFFDGWTFYGALDNLTHGAVNYLDQSDAMSTGLASIDPTTQHAFIKVDNTSVVPFGGNRSSIRIDTTDSYGVGSLWIIDIVHLPFGCSVWPAFWTRGQNWPTMGEIDIIEGVNLVTQNKMGLHTLTGCTHTTGTNQLGTNDNLDCNFQNATVGCGVTDTTPLASFGDPFNQAGGGVWATQFDVSGVFIWFWQRGSVPQELQGNATSTLDTSTWGAPVASFPSTSCNTAQFFGEQTLVLDITLCGDDAGGVSVYPQTCANQAPNVPNPMVPPPNVSACYFNNVVGPGSPRFDDAFFEINYLRSYSNIPGATTTSASSGSSASGSGAAPTSAAGGSGSSSTSTGGGAGGAGNNAANTSGAGSRYGVSAYALALGALAGAVLL